MHETFAALLLCPQPTGSLQEVTRNWRPVGEVVFPTEQDYCYIYLFIFPSPRVLDYSFFLF